MNTKVKGSAIKDGSVNLKSFDTFTKGTVFNLKDPIVSITKESKYPYTENVIYALYNDKAYRINKGEKAIINQGPPVYISYINNEVYIEDTTNFIPSTATITLFAGTTITIPTPDWNAQENESGYIKNRPFYTDINTPLGEYNGGAMDNDTIEINVGEFDRFIIRTPYSFIEKEPGGISYFDDNPLPTNIPQVKITQIRYQDGWIFITVDNIDYNTQLVDWINNEWCGGPYTSNTVKIPQYFIPDIVVKTTPQTLTDNDKNQALTNLGIDPVVWKYMCEPYRIDSGDPEGIIPEELIPIIFDADGNLRDIVQNLIVFVNGPIQNWDENELYDIDGGSIAINTDGTWHSI